MFEHPLVARDQAGAFADERQPAALAETEATGETEEGGRPHVDANLIEPGVARAGDRALHVDRALGVFIPVVERRVADVEGGRAVNFRGLRHLAVVERGERDDGFEGGGRRIGRLERPAEKRLRRVRFERFEIGLVDAGDEIVQVERRPRSHHQHLAGDRVEDDEGAAAAAFEQGFLGEFLPLEIEGGDEGSAGARALDLLFEQLVAALVEEQPLHARLAGELGVEKFFQAGAAFGFLPQRLVEIDRAGRQFPDAAGVTDDMRREPALRIETPVERMQDQSGRQFRLDVAGFFLADLAGHQQGQPAAVAVVVEDFVVGLRHLVFDEELKRVDPGAGPVDDEIAVGVFKLAELQGDLIGDLVLGDRSAVAVHDLAARRGDFQGDGAGVLAGADGPVRSTAGGGLLGRILGANRHRRETQDQGKSKKERGAHHGNLRRLGADTDQGNAQSQADQTPKEPPLLSAAGRRA